MKTYTNKSNAARSAKQANGGTLNGLTLMGSEGAWYYAKLDDVGDNHTAAPAMSSSLGTPVAAKAKKSAPAKKAVPAKKSAGAAKPATASSRKASTKPATKKAAKKAPAKKAARKAAAPAQEYDVKNGPTQGRISGYHIDQDRDEKHGVKRRSAGTIGGRLWAIFDKLAAKAGSAKDLLIATVKESPLVADFNDNKVVIEFYYWRRYHGVRGRGRKQKVA